MSPISNMKMTSFMNVPNLFFRYMIPAEKSKVNPSDPTKKIEKVFISGSMTAWGSVEMVRTKGDAYFCVIIDCYEGNVFYKFCVDGEWTIDYSMVTIRLFFICVRTAV